MLEAHGSQASSVETPETTEAHKEDKTTHRGWSDYLIGRDTYFIQVPTSAETSLCRTEWQEVTYVRADPRGRPLQLPLFLHKGLVLGLARLNFAPLGPTLLQKAIQELVKKMERSDVIPTNNNFRAEAAQTLSNDGSRSHGWQDTIHKLLEKATGITTKFCL